MQKELLAESFLSLKEYIESEEYKGWDPYDGLNSTFFKRLPFNGYKIPKWAWIQLFKLNPINLRIFLGVKKEYNTKGLGLFLIGYCQLYKLAEIGIIKFGNKEDLIAKIIHLTDLIIELQSRGYSGACWGYNFDWQNRIFFQPKGTPTVVATSFVANSLFEAYQITKDKKTLEIALSSCDFIINDLNRTYLKGGKFIFSYSPLDHSQVYNASLLGARLLAQGSYYSKNNSWLDQSKKAVEAICDLQNHDGSWYYGNRSNQKWVDSFHTGFNLECLHEYEVYSKDSTFQPFFEKGLDFYIENFFLTDGTPKYYHNKKYPIDIHSPAQFIITLLKSNNYENNKILAEKVLDYTLKNMRDKRGYFYYQLKPIISSKIPYLRWAQAWMFYSLAYFLNFSKKNLRQ